MSVLLKHTLNCCKLQKSFQNKTRIMPFISKTVFLNILLLVLPISFIHFELWNQPYYSKYVRYLNLGTDKILVYRHLLKSNLSLRMTLQAIIYYFAAIQHPMMISVFWHLRTRAKENHVTSVRYQPPLNRKITSLPLYLFFRPW